MTKKQAIEFLAGKPQELVVVSYADYNGGFDCFIEAADNEKMLPDFSYVEWRGDHTQFIKDRNKVLDIWTGQAGVADITTTLGELVMAGNVSC